MNTTNEQSSQEVTLEEIERIPTITEAESEALEVTRIMQAIAQITQTMHELNNLRQRISQDYNENLVRLRELKRGAKQLGVQL